MQMQNRISFGRWEATALLINLICTKLFLFFTRMTVEDAGNAGWIMTIYISLLAFVMFAVLLKLLKRFEGKDLLDIAEYAGGKWLKIIAGLVVSAILFYLTVMVLREFTEEMKVVSLPFSPLSYVMMFFLSGIIIGSFLGMEAIVRFHAIIVPVITAGYIAILIGVIPRMDFTNLLPIFGTGPNNIFGKGFFKVSVFGELFILFLLPPFLKNYKNVRSTGYVTIAVSAVLLTAGSLFYILTFQYPFNTEPFLPIYQMARLINLGRFFERIESIFVFIWAMAAFLYLSATFYLLVYVFSKAAGLKYLRPLILPFAVLVFSATFIPQNLVTVIKSQTVFYSSIAWLMTFVFSGLILAIAFIKERRKERGKA